MMKLKNASDALHAECRYLEKKLDGKSFLCGDRPSAAEAVAFPDVRLIQRALDRKGDVMESLGFENSADQYPYLFGWMQRVESIDGMEKTMPYHW